MATLGDIKQYARDLIVDVTSTVESGLLPSINRAQREMELKTFCPEQTTGFTYQYSQSFGNNSGPGWIDFSDLDGTSYDFIRLANDLVYLARTDSTQDPAAKYIPHVTHNEAAQLKATARHVIDGSPDLTLRGPPTHYELTHGGSGNEWWVWIFPFPDDNGPIGGQYEVQVYFWFHLAPLVADADTNWFTNNAEAERYMVYRAAEDALMAIRDPMGVTYRALAREQLIAAQRASKRARWASDRTIDVNPANRVGSVRP